VTDEDHLGDVANPEKPKQEPKLVTTANDGLKAGKGLIGSRLDEGETKALVDDDNSRRPVFTRMGLRYLEIATLMFYDIEFERDDVSLEVYAGLTRALY
jgi:hypothetical protein